jgi:hypothetical protein
MASVGSASAQYAGPALLTRGQAPSAMAATQIDFRPFLALDAGYDSGLNGISVDPNGNPNVVSSYALSVSAGVSGLHSWKHTLLGLDYRANFNHYGNHPFFDGTNQTLMLGVSHMLSRHTLLSIRQSAGLSSQNYGTPILIQTVPFDPATTFQPTNDFFDNRTIFFSTQADLRIQRSTRLSFDIGGDAYLTRYRSSALYGTKGVGARGDIMYRLTRRSTIGVAYNYLHFNFRGVLSSTDVHTLMASYAVSLTRTLEFTSTFGVSRYETKFQREVPLDPVVAAIICTPGLPCTATQLFYGRNYTPNIMARISKTIPRGVLFATGGHTITPGNGLFLTSTSSNIAGGYTYTGLKRWAVNTGVNYSFADSVGNILGNYSNVAFTGNLSRQIGPSTHFILGFGARQYQSQDFRNYNRWAYNVHVGFGFAPGDVPVRFW